MAKIAIVAPSAVPFVIGGAEKFWWGLIRAFNNYTQHEVDLIKLPTPELSFWELLDSYRRFSELDLSHFDAVISTKYPAWMVYHKNHHCYMQHKLRGLYDLYVDVRDKYTSLFNLPSAFDRLVRIMLEEPKTRDILPVFWKEIFALRYREDLSDFFSFPGFLIKEIIHFLDDIALSPEYINSYSAISKHITTREGYFPEGVRISVIHHPSNLEGLHCKDYQYIFTASRLTELKRVNLIVEAFKQVRGDVELRIAGTGSEMERLKEMAAGDTRVKFLGFVSDQELVDLYASALFVPFVPYDEDYGLITVEAMQSSKAVLTVNDSGGVTELVEDGVNGFSVEPAPEALAEAMQKMVVDYEATIAMGRKALESVSDIRWDKTVKSLTELIESNRGAIRGGEVILNVRPKILVLSTFGIAPPRSGGQLRIYNLYKELAKKADIVVLSLSSSEKELTEYTLSYGFKEIRVPKTPEHIKAEKKLEEILGVSSEDIACIDGFHLTPKFCDLVREYEKKTDIIVLSHPYLFYAVEYSSKEKWYDAHNVEYDMKKDVLLSDNRSEVYLNRVFEVEKVCCEEAGAIFACSETDAKRFGELYGVDSQKVRIVPNGISPEDVKLVGMRDRNYIRNKLGLGERDRLALFMGSWHGPNIEAIRYIADIASKFEEYKFLIVGSVCYHDVCKIFPANVVKLGVVDENEKAVVLSISDVALNPIICGSGTNLKLLEYLAYNLPVITTPHGNRGFCFKDEEHLFVRYLDQFDDVLIQLLNSENLEKAKVMASQGAKLALSKYNWKVCAKPMLDTLATWFQGEALQ